MYHAILLSLMDSISKMCDQCSYTLDKKNIDHNTDMNNIIFRMGAALIIAKRILDEICCSCLSGESLIRFNTLHSDFHYAQESYATFHFYHGDEDEKICNIRQVLK